MPSERTTHRSQPWRVLVPVDDERAAFESRHWLARWSAAMAAIAAVLLMVSLFTPGAVAARRPDQAVLIVLVCVVLVVGPLVRGARVRDAEVLAMAIFVDVLIAVIGQVSPIDGRGVGILLVLVWPTLLLAVYLPRALVAVQVAACAGVGVAVFHDLEQGAGVAALRTALLVCSMGMMAAVVVQLRERLSDALRETRREARTDAQTGLANRRGVTELAPVLWAAAARRGDALEVMLFDIDKFKEVNDVWGHRVGDDVLAEVAAIIRRSVRGDDLAARFGGEEFLVVAVVGADSAGQLGERIREAIERGSGPVRVTVSCGSVLVRPGPGGDAEAALSALVPIADRALYEAKAAGRNRVRTASA